MQRSVAGKFNDRRLGTSTQNCRCVEPEHGDPAQTNLSVLETCFAESHRFLGRHTRTKTGTARGNQSPRKPRSASAHRVTNSRQQALRVKRTRFPAFSYACFLESAKQSVLGEVALLHGAWVGALSARQP